jgi:hypothetical protein
MNYSKIKFELTNSIRNLELVNELLIREKADVQALSEVEYWIRTLELLRNSLYDCIDVYEGQLNIEESVKEIREEIANFYTITKGTYTSIVYAKIKNAWQGCKIVEEQYK